MDLVSGVPENMDTWVAAAGGAAENLARRAGALREAQDSFRARCDRSLVPGDLPDVAATVERLSELTRVLGEDVARTAAAFRRLDTTPMKVDIVIVEQSALDRALTLVDPLPTTVEGWRRRAYEKAGVDITGWDTSDDMMVNDARIQAIWERYGQLWLADPSKLQWAGMAKLGGCLVYAGMMDLRGVVALADPIARQQALRQWVERQMPGVDNIAVSWLTGQLLNLSSDTLRRFLAKFQQMQKAIADDLLWQHEAYLSGGLDALRPHRAELGEAWELWQRIDSGDPATVTQANHELLRREQHDILPDHYAELRAIDPPVGEVFTRVLTATAQSPIPGGRPYAEVIDIAPSAGGDDPLPFQAPWFLAEPIDDWLIGTKGNVAETTDRWAWIEADMWPAYQRYAYNSEQLRRSMEAPVRTLADEHRILPIPYP
jgi:hypothetical protein